VITDINGCTASSPVLHFPLVGVDEFGLGFYFYIYPNPANNEINIMISNNNAPDLTVNLFDDIGREIFSKHFNLTSQVETLNFKLSDLSKGIYFLHILSGNRKYVRPVIKN
jgi:hypothetical protein